jgi:spermidine synthase
VSAVVPALFFLSGLCGLVYQLIWTRWLGMILGNFGTATATVLAIFMCGLAVGNAVFGRVAAGRSPRQGLLLYAALEGGIAVLAACSPLFFAGSTGTYGLLISSSSLPAARALLCTALLLPPTILMGGTLPAMVQALSVSAPGRLGMVYGVNTLGAALGPLLATFALMPALGMRNTMWVGAGVNAVVAIAAFILARRLAPGPGTAGPAVVPAAAMAAGTPRIPALVPYLLGAVSGFLALAFEIALTRLVVLTVTDSSVYGFAIILSAFLFGIAGGAYLLRLKPPGSPDRALLAFAACLGIAWLFSLTTPWWDQIPLLMLDLWWRPISAAVRMLANFALVLALLLALTIASGYALPVLAAALKAADGGTIGRLFAANTLGAALGAPVAGFILLPLLGLHSTLIALGAGAILCASLAVAYARPGLRMAVIAAAPVLAMIGLVLPGSDLNILNAGINLRPLEYHTYSLKDRVSALELAHRKGTVVFHRDTWSGSIAVYMKPLMGMVFTINGKPDGSSYPIDMHLQVISAHLPVFIHGDPKKVLLVGLGTGVTAGSLSLHPGIAEIHVVEIEPAITDVARVFSDFNHRIMDNPRTKIHLDDARHFLLTDRDKYDIIISEPSNMYVSGMLNLYTTEFYRIASKRLAPGGLFFQFMHCYQADAGIMRGLLRTVGSVFPRTTFWATDDGDAFVVAGIDPFNLDPEGWAVRFRDKPLAADLGRIGIDSSWKMLAAFLYGPGDVGRHTGAAVACTDDYPWPEFRSPLIRLSTDATQAVLRELRSAGPLEPVPLARETAVFRERLGGLYLAGGSLSRARTEFDRAVALGIRTTAALYGLAFCEYCAGNNGAADAALKKLFTVQPGHRQGREIEKTIREKSNTTAGIKGGNTGL